MLVVRDGAGKCLSKCAELAEIAVEGSGSTEELELVREDCESGLFAAWPMLL